VDSTPSTMGRRCRRRTCCAAAAAILLGLSLLAVAGLTPPQSAAAGLLSSIIMSRRRSGITTGPSLPPPSDGGGGVPLIAATTTSGSLGNGGRTDDGFETLAQARVRAAAEGRSTVAALGGRKHPAKCGFLVAVLSARENAERRERVRGWAQPFLAASLRVHGYPRSQVVFIVGDGSTAATTTSPPADGNISRALGAEHARHGDLLAVPVVDVYRNSAAKMLSFYRLLHDISLVGTAVIKMDDDAILFPRAFFEALYVSPCAQLSSVAAYSSGADDGKKEEQEEQVCEQPGLPSRTLRALRRPRAYVWWGSFRVGEAVQRRYNPSSARWALSRQELRRSHFPSYATGTTHVLNWPLVSELGAQAERLARDHRGVWMEDSAHGLWFEALMRGAWWRQGWRGGGQQPPGGVGGVGEAGDVLFEQSCQLFDYRFARDLPQCVSDSLSLVPNFAGELAQMEPADATLSTAQLRTKYCGRHAIPGCRWPSALAWLEESHLQRLRQPHPPPPPPGADDDESNDDEYGGDYEAYSWPIQVCGTPLDQRWSYVGLAMEYARGGVALAAGWGRTMHAILLHGMQGAASATRAAAAAAAADSSTSSVPDGTRIASQIAMVKCARTQQSTTT
jgi:hypothetical protein